MAFNMFEGKEPYGEFYSRWSKESFGMMSGGLDMFNRMNRAWLEMAENPFSAPPTTPDAFLNFSKGWLEGYARMYRTWMESVQKIGETCKYGVREKDQPEHVLKACGEISQKFANDWLSFVSDQSRSFMNLREACSAMDNAEPAKGKANGGRG
jgi:hypothetical protein